MEFIITYKLDAPWSISGYAVKKVKASNMFDALLNFEGDYEDIISIARVY